METKPRLGYLMPALVAGGAAGTCVDIALFPLDTVKTRLQSAQGFWKAGGFKGIYSGLASAALGSAPTASLFFVTYESVKYIGNQTVDKKWSPMVHMAAASSAEVHTTFKTSRQKYRWNKLNDGMEHGFRNFGLPIGPAIFFIMITACLIRVPVEVVKQRTQANIHMTSLQTLKLALVSEGFIGLYRGYLSTVIREIPFSFIQFPLWEYMKSYWSKRQGHPTEPWQSSIIGAISGCVAAGLTTPLDVAKTRIILAEKGTPLATGHIGQALSLIYRDSGYKGLFSGVLPRMLWISIGGAIFLGVYDKVRKTVVTYYNQTEEDS